MEARSISYVVDATDREHALAAMERVAPVRKESLLMGVWFGAIGALNVLTFVMSRHADTIHVGMTFFFSLAAGFHIARYRFGRTNRRIAAGARIVLTIDDAGLACSEPKRENVAWTSVTAIKDTPGVIVILRKWRAPIAIPKRVFPDAGAALWQDLDRRLTGTRDLVRPLGVPRSITNTNATA